MCHSVAQSAQCRYRYPCDRLSDRTTLATGNVPHVGHTPGTSIGVTSLIRRDEAIAAQYTWSAAITKGAAGASTPLVRAASKRSAWVSISAGALATMRSHTDRTPAGKAAAWVSEPHSPFK